MTLAKIWGLKALSKPYDQACIDWAEQLLIAGNTSENVLILASLGLDKKPEYYDVERYFLLALQDLNVTEPDYFESIKCYGIHLCNQALTGKLGLEKAANLLAEIYPSTNYDYDIFSIWTDLLDDLYLLENEDPYFDHPELTKTNKQAYIEKQIRHFAVLLSSDVPPDFMNRGLCHECQTLAKMEWRKKTRITGFQKVMQVFKLQKPVYCTECLTCGSTNITRLLTVEAREQALRILQK